jgi:ATP-dependent Clp protease ATP-binding subunit ClpB
MTSNLGSEFLVNQPEGEDTSAVREQVMGMVRAHFRPNSSTGSTRSSCSTAAEERDGPDRRDPVRRLTKLLEERKVVLTLDAAARDWLAAKGWDPAYGARPAEAGDPAHRAGSAGGDDPGRRDRQDGDRVAIRSKGNVLTFNGKAPQTAEIAQFEAPVPKRKLN